MAEPMKAPGEPAFGERRSWGLLLALVLFGLTLLVVQARLEPPAPKGQDAPAAEFSGGRAHEILRGLAGDGSPHPVGSAANARVRDTIVAELRRLGYAPELQEGTACSLGLNCAWVQNIVARLDGTQAGKAVLLMAHYDSVPAGPGVADDLSGVATVLEVARALKAGPSPQTLRNPVILLFTDGEEAGLLGAEHFAASPAAREVGVVVNLEARGTAGPSLMFETVGDDAWTVGHYAGAAPRPITSSIYATIYEALPNDTDLSVFRRAGYHGLNFAFIRNPTHYHTTEDNVENLSPATLQHHGDNALAAVRALAQADLASPPKGDAVFFDVLGFFVIRWPKAWTPALAVLALVLVVAASVLAGRRTEVPRRGLLFGLLGFLGSVVVAALLAFGLARVVGASSPGPWAESPGPDVAAFWMLAIAVVALLAGAVSRRAGAAGLWSGVWIGWAVLGVVVSLTAPGIAYLFVVPALVAGLVGLAARPGGTLSSLVPALLAAVLWMPILLPLYDGLGKTALVVIGVLAAALFTSLAPLVPDSGRLGRRLLPALGLVLALACAGLAFASPPYSEESPRPLSFQFLQDADSGQARWLALGPGPLPAPVREAGRFPEERVQAYPWASAYRVPAAPAPRLDAPGPQVSVLEDSSQGGKRRLRLLLVSNRQAPDLSVVIPPEAKLESARIDGREIPLNVRRKGPGQPDGWMDISALGLKPAGAEMEVILGEAKPLDWYVYDNSPGLPAGGEALQNARPASAVAIQQGDNTAILRKVRI